MKTTGSAGKWAPYLAALAVFIAAVIALFWEGFSGSKMLYGLDTFAEHLPFSIFARKCMLEYGQLPVWMPDIFMGIPLIGSANCIIFYPTNLFFLLLPVELHRVFLPDFIFHMLLAFAGMILFLSGLGLKKPAALAGGFFYATCGFLVSGIYAGAWIDIKSTSLIPFVMFFLMRAVSSGRLGDFLSASIFMALQVLALGMQIMAYTSMLYTAFFIYLLAREKGLDGKKKTGRFAGFVFSAVMIAAFGSLQFLPTAEYMQYSWRTDFSYEHFTVMSFHPAETISFILPQFFGLFGRSYWGFEQSRAFTPYIGVVPVFLFFFAFLNRENRSMAVFLALSSLALLALAFGGHTPLYKILYHVPVFNRFRNPSRFLSVLSFTIAAISAIGVDNLVKYILAAAGRQEDGGMSVRNAYNRFILAAGAVTAALGVMALNMDMLGQIIQFAHKAAGRGVCAESWLMPYIGLIRQDAVYFSAAAAAVAILVFAVLRHKIKSALIFAVILCGLHFVDMHRVLAKFIMYEDLGRIAGKDSVSETLTTDKGKFRVIDMQYNWFPNRNLYFGLEFFSGYHGVLPYRWARMHREEAFYDINVLRAFNIKYHIFSGDPGLRDLKKIVDGPISLYEDPFAMERAFFVDNARIAAGDDEAIAMLKTGFKPGTAVVTEDLGLKGPYADGRYDARISMYTPSRMIVETDNNRPGLLVVSNLYFPQWKARVDGEPARVHVVNYASMGVKLKEGKHRVELFYDMTLTWICVLLTVLALAFYAIVILSERKKYRAETEKARISGGGGSE